MFPVKDHKWTCNKCKKELFIDENEDFPQLNTSQKCPDCGNKMTCDSPIIKKGPTQEGPQKKR